jgi:hypothetical protein
MDDVVADLDASTTVRMLLLYSKEWTGPIADRVKAELVAMRKSMRPTNAELLASSAFAANPIAIDGCELCDAPLGQPPKFVEAYTHWNARARMCMHCSFFLSPGFDLGDGALFICDDQNAWRHVHGEAKVPAVQTQTKPTTKRKTMNVYQAPLHFRVRRFGRKVIKKCASVVQGWFRKSA